MARWYVADKNQIYAQLYYIEILEISWLIAITAQLSGLSRATAVKCNIGFYLNGLLPMRILVINCGSSSVKYHLIKLPDDERILSGKVQSIGESGGEFKTHEQALQHVVAECGDAQIDAVGHRVVHGGDKFIDPTIIDSSVSYTHLTLPTICSV